MKKLTGTWKAPFYCPKPFAGGPSSLTTLDGGVAKGYTRIPPLERAVDMQLCPNSTWRGEPSLPSRPCKHRRTLPAGLTRPVGSRFRLTRYGVVAGLSGQGTEGPARGLS